MAIESISAINSFNSSNRTARILAESTLGLRKSQARLSSGKRIVSPEDDAAGLAQAIKIDAQISRTYATQSNVSNAVSFSQTQDGALQQAQKALDRMGELSILAQDSTKSSADLANYQQEFTQLQDFASSLGNDTFNGVNLFSSSSNQVTTDSEGGTTDLNGINYNASGASGGLGDVFSGISVSSPSNAQSALTAIETATQNLSALRANVGASIGRLNVTNETLSVQAENLSAASSRIQDADIAAESAQYARYQLLVQSGTVQLALQNRQARSSFSLLG